ncbi:MAG: serine acetyltransferase [Nitrospirota bacterium]
MIEKGAKLCQRLTELVDLIHEDWCVNSRDWTMPGFRALAVHRFGTWLTDRSGGIMRWGLMKLYLVMYRYIRNHYGIEIPLTVKVGRRLHLVHQSGIIFHWKAEIGDDCVVRQNVTLGAGYSDKTINNGPKIGNHVQVGVGVVIFAGINIGDGAFIGPNAVVMSNIPAGARVFVDPPRMLHGRFGTKGDVNEDGGRDRVRQDPVVGR